MTDYTKLREFCTRFIDGDMGVVGNGKCGLCRSSSIFVGSSLMEEVLREMEVRGIIKDNSFPINDETLEYSAAYQYGYLPHYEGRQLELRKELCRKMLKFIGEKENG